MSILLQIIGAIVSSLFGSVVEYFKRKKLEEEAAKVEALRLYAESLKLSQAAQDQVDAAVAAHQAAQAQVVTLQEKLDALRRWNDKVRNLGRK